MSYWSYVKFFWLPILVGDALGSGGISVWIWFTENHTMEYILFLFVLSGLITFILCSLGFWLYDRHKFYKKNIQQ
jgi:hypothetical protein